MPIHYSMDPEKNLEWAAKAQSEYLRSQDWNREMEIDFTEVGGVRATPSFRREVHVRDLEVNPYLPLCLCCDFNVGLMAWQVAQIVKNEAHFIDEIALEPASVPEMVKEFRNRYPAHAAEIWVFGDATGNARSVHDKQSDYDLLRLAFRAYASPLVFFVPTKNPPVRESLNSFELLLKSQSDGKPRLFVSPKCQNLIADCLECILDKKGDLLKINKIDDPYSKRTHALDAGRYFTSRQWPTVAEVIQSEMTGKRVQPTFDYRLPGDL